MDSIWQIYETIMVLPKPQGDDYQIMIARPAKPLGRASSPIKTKK